MKKQILVISEKKDATHEILETVIHLAKNLKKEIFFLSVSKPLEVVQNESQLTAIRSINYSHCKSVDQIQHIINPLSKANNLKIDFKHVIGNIKNEVLEQINQLQPEIIVLEKRKPKLIDINRDKLTDFILKHHQGIVVLADRKCKSISGNISLAILSDSLSEKATSLAKSLTNLNPTDNFKYNSISPSSKKETIAKLKEKNYQLVFVNRYEQYKKLRKVISSVDSSFILTS